MSVEFHCNHCQKLLRVPDESVGRQARCPSCGSVQEVPLGRVGATSGAQEELPSKWAFVDAPAGVAPPGVNPYSSGDAANPYATPTPLSFAPKAAPIHGPITPQQPSIEAILRHSFQVWQQNLGLLVGTTLVVFGISFAIGMGLFFAQFALEANGEAEASGFVGGIGNIVSQLIHMYLGIGQVQIALKLARGQDAEFADLFAGGPRFLPVLGFSILAGIALVLGFMACIVPGVLLLLMWWPAYYLVVDERVGVLDSFSVAYKISENNWGTTFLMWLIGVGINLLGCLALGLGIIFAAPLVSMMFATAYLMMSGQLSTDARPPASYPV